MSQPSHSAQLPRGLLLGAVLLVALTLAAALLARPLGLTPSSASTAAPVASRDLYFYDRNDGSVTVHEAGSNTLLARFAPGTHGFVRATLRTLVRERRRQGFGPEVPFQLTLRADGRLTLLDRTTGRRVDLEAFGATNAASFAILLQEGVPPASGWTLTANTQPTTRH